MKTIAILGANGQVGVEVCLYLHAMGTVRVIAICRSELAATFLTRAGVECRIGDASRPEGARELLRDADVVADFSLPKGLSSGIRSSIGNLLGSVIASAPDGASFVYVSSLMAFGMGSRDERFDYKIIPRTVYAASKRFGEKLALRECRRTQRSLFVFRLGDVHGVLQGITRGLMSPTEKGPAMVPRGESYSVFVSTIAQALVAVSEGKVETGTYSLLTEPALTWEQLYVHYAALRGVPADYTVEGETTVRARISTHVSGLLAAITSQREVGIANILTHTPSLEQKAKAQHLLRKARNDIGAPTSATHRPFSAFRGTKVPGKRLTGLGAWQDVHVDEKLRALIEFAQQRDAGPNLDNE